MIPFLDLRHQSSLIKEDILERFGSIIDRAGFVLGPEVQEFEDRFAAYSGTEHAIAVNSGTSALHLALRALDIGPGDEVITTPSTFIATVAAIEYCGARPVFVDIDPDRWTLDPAKIEQAITPATKAVMPVHLHGRPAQMTEICDVAKQHNLAVIEDAAQSHGATLGGAKAGSLGDIAGFSFYPGKNLGAFGEGGAVTTNNRDLADKVRMLRDWGQQEKYVHVEKGFNYRMDAFQGAVLGIKLNHIDDWTESRRRLADHYREKLRNYPVRLPYNDEAERHVFHVFGICCPQRDALRKHLSEGEIGSNMHYPFPIHLLPSHRDLGYSEGDFPIAEAFANEELSLPIFPEMTFEQVETVCQAVGSFFDRQ